jgi:hypothetical protein
MTESVISLNSDFVPYNLLYPLLDLPQSVRVPTVGSKPRHEVADLDAKDPLPLYPRAPGGPAALLSIRIFPEGQATCRAAANSPELAPWSATT